MRCSRFLMTVVTGAIARALQKFKFRIYRVDISIIMGRSDRPLRVLDWAIARTKRMIYRSNRSICGQFGSPHVVP